jgi:NADPH:quinone reductase-like Zn-dependent oxidoreductase
MQAVALDRFGGPEVLGWVTMPVPQIGARDVLIAVDTAGVGVWEADMREGWWPKGKPPLPLVLGTDGSGTVAAVGSRVRRFEVGDRVYGYNFANPNGGFYAEYAAVPAENIGLIPKRLDMKHAGAAATSGLTAQSGIDEALHLRRDETIIVHAASGSVGAVAVQFAKLRGARVFATASGEDGIALARQLGAEAVIDGHSDNITEAALEFAPDGFDAALGFAGGEGFEQCIDAVRRGGRVAYPNGVEPTPRKRRGIEMKSYDGLPGRREFQRLNRAIERARLKVLIAAEYPLAEAAKAHERLARGHLLGKIVLRVR